MDIKKLQDEVNARWGSQDYNLCHVSDTSHALVHMTKALGKIASAVNDAEHEQRAPKAEEVEAYLADLVICAARFAHGVVDLDVACAARLAAKFPVLPQWGIFEVAMGRWWPRAFRTREEALAHLERCKGPGMPHVEIRVRSIGDAQLKLDEP